MKKTNTNNRKAQAARENGRKSKGPITPAGKRKSSFNALRHGYTSHRAVLISTESEEELRAFSQAYFDTLQPAAGLETLKVEEMIAAEWRVRRIWSAETTLLDAEIARLKAFPCPIEPVDDKLRTALALQSATGFPSTAVLAEAVSLPLATEIDDQNPQEFSDEKPNATSAHPTGGQPMLLQRYARSLQYQASRAFHQFQILKAERLRQEALAAAEDDRDRDNDDDHDPDTSNTPIQTPPEPNEPNQAQNTPQPPTLQPDTSDPDTPRAMRYRYLRSAPPDTARCATM